MNDDDLRRRLRATDPAGDEHIPPIDGPAARARLERIMSTAPDTSTTQPPAPPSGSGWATRWPLLAAAAAVVAIAIGAVTMLGGDDGDDQEVAGEAVSFALDPGLSMGMCMALDETTPAPGPNPVAFGGTVESVENGTVTIAVDRTYEGEPMSVVTLTAGTDVPVALDGVEFVAGQRYLVTVLDGTVAICGLSGPATPELEAHYERWYGA